MSDPSSQPTQPLTDEDFEELREYATSDNLDLTPQTQQRAWELLLVAYNEVDRLRTQSVRHVDCNAEAWAAAARVTRDLRAELDSMTQFAESLRAERDRSVRSCGELGVELDRLRTWNGLMELMDEKWPEDIFPTREDDTARDPGPRILSLLRWNIRLRRELAEMETDRDKYQNWYDASCAEVAEAYRARNEED